MSDPIGYGGSYIGDVEDQRRKAIETRDRIAALETELAEAANEQRRMTDLIERFGVEPGKLSDRMHKVVNMLESQRNQLREQLAEVKERAKTTCLHCGEQISSHLPNCAYVLAMRELAAAKGEAQHRETEPHR